MTKRIFLAIFAVTATTVLLSAILLPILLVPYLQADTLSYVLPLLILIPLLLILLAAPLALLTAKKITNPLRQIQKPSGNPPAAYQELSPLFRRLAEQKEQLAAKDAELQRRKNEFETATNHMSEGLILLDENATVLSINRSGTKLLRTDFSCVGNSIFQLQDSAQMHKLFEDARHGEHAESTVVLDEQEYRVSVGPTMEANRVVGINLLITDITEEEKAEKLRQEFTANVSHELKTPLHTISGCAELLAGGMVKTEDVTHFSERIYTEAKRMITLVEDIIKLSHLDEGVSDMQRESVDLYTLANASIQSLSQVAQEAGVKLTLRGTSAPVYGIRQLLSLIIFNLCENAIKYNKKNGRVDVTVQNTDVSVILTVKDTGIGIPKGEQERIFERFYRVDKSHSKALGGTGLGLSIVKHSAKVHRAKIDLQSTPGVGTTVTVQFPK